MVSSLTGKPEEAVLVSAFLRDKILIFFGNLWCGLQAYWLTMQGITQ